MVVWRSPGGTPSDGREEDAAALYGAAQDGQMGNPSLLGREINSIQVQKLDWMEKVLTAALRVGWSGLFNREARKTGQHVLI